MEKPNDVERYLTLTSGEDLLLFYSGWSELSNFHSSKFFVNGRTYRTVEHFYQSQKALHFGDVLLWHKIMQAGPPSHCKKLGKMVNNFNRQEWNLVAEKVMLHGVTEKFLQSPWLRQKLQTTGDAIIAEATNYDDFWATGLHIKDDRHTDKAQWPGQNKLGEILMCVRKMLRAEDDGDVKCVV